MCIRDSVYQQLAHLEALAGDFDLAWRLLWLGLNQGDETSGDYLARLGRTQSIDAEEDCPWRYGCLDSLDGLSELAARFPLFHVTRLGSLEVHAAYHHRRELDEALSSFTR